MKKLKLTFATILSAALLFACGNGNSNNETTNADTTDVSQDEKALEDANLEDEDLTVNLNDSRVKWEGTMLGVKSHTGWVKLNEGNVVVRDGEIVGGNFIVDMTSITPTDSNYDKDNTQEKLIGHLSSDDFFLVSEYPTASFEITKAEMDNNRLIGNLTVRGITHEETIENVEFNREAGTASGELTFDRTKYDVKFQHPAQDMVLNNDIELEINLSTDQNVADENNSNQNEEDLNS